MSILKNCEFILSYPIILSGLPTGFIPSDEILMIMNDAFILENLKLYTLYIFHSVVFLPGSSHTKTEEISMIMIVFCMSIL